MPGYLLKDYPTNEEVLNRLRKYLSRRAKDLSCPICKTYQWNVAGVVDLEAGHATAEDSLVLPVIVTVCAECSYVRQFSWGIVKQATENG